MELREFAEHILFGNDILADKLLQPQFFTDENPGSARNAPLYPGRPQELQFGLGHINKKVRFPTQNELEQDEKRGVVLHFFANHELLAMEVMALLLLKFPQAPKAFRMGIAQTILEEQRHMSLYMGRMKELGVEFGSLAVNDFFWKCLSPMTSPLDFVVHMSLTFEQANLDYSYFYHDLILKIGDTKTAAILDTVYKEEIGHVKHGVVWFDRMRDQEKSQWENYTQALRFPLTPARAKGLYFCREGRRAAGLDENFIDELQICSSSKGRPPDVYFFNPTCEVELARGKVGFSPPRIVRQLQGDLCGLMGFLASKEDMVLVEQKPSAEFLKQLTDCGFELPQWLAIPFESEMNASSYDQKFFGHIYPWGRSPQSDFHLTQFYQKSRDASLLSPAADAAFSLQKKVSSKAYAAEIYCKYMQTEEFSSVRSAISPVEFFPQICASLEETLFVIEKQISYSGIVVIKSPYSSSGRGMLRVTSSVLSTKDKNSVLQILSSQGVVIIEPWVERVADFSYQMKVLPDGQIVCVGDTRFLADNRGQYIASFIEKKTAFLKPDLISFLYDKKRGDFFKNLREMALCVARELTQEGFVGPFGIDAFVYKNPQSLDEQDFKIKFLSEINPRFTMGRVALELRKRVVPGSFAIWHHVPVAQIIKKGFTDAAYFATEMSRRFPVEVSSVAGGAWSSQATHQVKKGVLFTNDPKSAQAFLTMLIVGEEVYEEVQRILFISG